MSYNGSGTFNINTAGQPVVTGTVISSSVFNALTADLATGLSTAITKDGQTTITANIPMNNYKFTGLAAGTAATDSVRLGQVQAGSATVITVTGTDTYTGTMSPALSAYAAGQMFTFTVPGTNTTACTINIDGLGAKSITRDGSTALVAGDLVLNSQVIIVYDGVRFQVVNSNSKTNWTVSGNLALSAGTTNQVQYLNGSKIVTGSSNLTFDGSTLTANALIVSNNSYLSAGTANGVVYLNAGKILTSGSALTFDGTNAATTGTSSAAKFIPTGGSATGNGVYLPASNVMAFSTNGVEAARINALQFSKFSNLGTYVGSTGAYHELRSDQSSQNVAYISNTSASPFSIEIDYTAADPNGTSNTFVACYGTSTLRASIRSNGGLANFQSNNVDLSDERTKTDIAPAPSYWDKIGALEIVTYKYKDQTHDDVNVGVIAQQVETVEPVWVDSDGFGEKDVPEDGVPLKTVYNKDITFAAIKALQEAMLRIEQLEAKVASLESAA